MIHRLVCAISVATVLVACGPGVEKVDPPEPPPPPVVVTALPEPTGACAAKTTYAWTPAGGGNYEAAGAAAGDTCDAGLAVITVRNRDTGKVLLSEDVEVSVMTNTVFAGVKSPASLKRGLDEWIAQRGSEETTADLPEWKPDQEQPSAGEFPFYPEEGMTREQYAAVRAAKQPTFCYVQGGESLACWALDRRTDTMTRVGVQLFPG